ncbi:MAG: ArsA-related P-loop ATPase, partial [Chloroflexota bacterium]
MPLSAFTELIGTRFIFFGGKGGVGKSTWACATATWLAHSAQAATFLLSLDPAHSLGDLLAAPVGPAARDVLASVTAQEL